MAPTYYHPDKNSNTISTGALLHYSKFTTALHHPFKKLELKTPCGQLIEIPTKIKNGLDYVDLSIHHFGGIPKTKTEKYPFINIMPPKINTLRAADPNLALYLHIKLGHINENYLQIMAKRGLIDGVPKNIGKLKFKCPICTIANGQKMPRGPIVNTAELRKGVRLHADFAIVNKESCREFVAAFCIFDAKTRHPWGFPTRSRRPPIGILKWLVLNLRRQGLEVIELRVDEDGSLANSTEFMAMCRDELNLTVQTTGGYASTINGKAETPNRTIKRMIRTMLIGAGLPDELWCFAFQYAIFLLRNRYNRLIDSVPAHLWNPNKPPIHIKNIPIWGSKAYIVTESSIKKQLQPRTTKDPRNYEDQTANAPQLPQHFDGYFVGFGSHTAVAIIWDPQSRRFRRAHHAYIDEYMVRVKTSEPFTPNATLLNDYPQQIRTDDEKLDMNKIKIVATELDFQNSAINNNECATIQVELPPKGRPVGLAVQSDTSYGLPLLAGIHPLSPLRNQIPADLHRNCWIVALNSKSRGYIEPITAKFCAREITATQEEESVTMEITFCRRKRPLTTDLQEIRATFDQSVPITPTVSYLVTAPERPIAEKSIQECLKGADRHHWKAACFHQYDKNAKIMLLSKPLCRSKLPKDMKVYKSIVAARVKDKGENIYKLEARHCMNGATMEKGKDFDFSYSPTVSAPALRMMIANAASNNRILGVLDVVNCFQNTATPIESRVFVTIPPYYIEWYNSRFPEAPLEDDGSGYVLQTINGMQGGKETGRNWYLVLREIMIKFGFKPCPSEPALFVYKSSTFNMTVVTSTDDLLCSYNHPDIFYGFRNFVEKIVPTTFQEGNKLKYLNFRIIQSEHGISIDQTEHIKKNVIDTYFPLNGQEIIKSADTPFRTDTQYETDLAEQAPATIEERINYEKLHGGPFNASMGKFNHIAQFSRFDIAYSNSRLAQYNIATNEAAFLGVKRLARYLVKFPHCPIMYPARKIEGTQVIRYDYDPGNFDTEIISNKYSMFVDSDHARDAKTRKSNTSIIATINGVACHWKMEKQNVIALHSTDAEVRAFFTATKMNNYLRDICTYLEITQDQPTIIYEDSQPCIDILRSNSITSRVKHMAVTVGYCHQEIELEKATPKKIKTTLNIADLGTKPLAAPSHHRHYEYARGVRYYPPPSSEHAKLMDLESHNTFRKSQEPQTSQD